MEWTLTDRQQHILWATVRHYIATAEPVGSKALVDEYNLAVSPATIRNAFGMLEKAGLLYQPHTSAGRVPSDSGYRMYVDQLLKPDESYGKQLELLFSDRLNWERWSLEALVRGAAHILSTLSGYITLITLPQTRTTSLRHLQLVAVEAKRVMLIVVTDAYETQSVIMELPPEDETDEAILEQELQILSNFLNRHLRGKSVQELAALDWSELDRQFQKYADTLTHLLTDLIRRTAKPATTQMMIRGVSEVLRQPEFSELQQVQTLIHLLEEEQDQLMPLIFEGWEDVATGKRVTIRIGAENPLEPMRTCTLISAVYRQGDTPVGSVGMLGPTRMLYENAIALVETAADYLSEAITQN